jgi:hypothetical protein
MRQVISREVALTEAYLDHQAQLSQPSFPRVQASVWPDVVGTVLGIVGFVMLVVEYWRAW